jgi:RimJ/RimL family protein N-acetyltransferase
LEPFSEGHLAGLNKMNSDPEVMRYLSAGRPETLEETRAVIDRVVKRWGEVGYSWWALIERDTEELVGAGAIQNLRRESTLVPDLACPLEIGWRLRRDRWGQGLAVEAARATGDFAFKVMNARELFAVCDPANTASAKVIVRRLRQVPNSYSRPISDGRLVIQRAKERLFFALIYFTGFHLLMGFIVPSGVFTSDPTNVMLSPLNEIFCVRTAPLKSGEDAYSIFHVITFSDSLTVYVP